MPMRNYKLTPQQRSQFQQMYLLNRMGSGVGEAYPVDLPGNLNIIEPLLQTLVINGLVGFEHADYRITAQGYEVLQNFRKRYTDYLQMYDVYCGVDLQLGEFAYASIAQLTIQQFALYISQPRWEDLRVAVSLYKGLDPLEIVFMSFLNEGRFDRSPGQESWCIDLMGDFLWDCIRDVCNTALHAEDLGDESVIQDIITQGTSLMIHLLSQQRAPSPADIAPSSPTTQEQQVITYTTTETVVESYTTYDVGYMYDPFYVPVVWVTPYWYW